MQIDERAGFLRDVRVSPFLVALYTATVVVGATMNLVTLPHLADLAGHPAFDLRFEAYSLEAARDLLRGLGEVGRREYLEVQLRLDGLFPLLYAPTASHLLAVLLRRAGLTTAARWIVAALVVLPTAGFDIAENTLVAEMLRRGPDGIDQSIVDRTWFATGAKWLAALAGLAFGTLVAAIALWKIWKARQS